jgi:hypothetical protein
VKPWDRFYRLRTGKLIVPCKACRCVGGAGARERKRNVRQVEREEEEEQIARTTETERAYLAGIIDGEGTITPVVAGKRYEYPDVRIAVYGTDQRLLDWIKFRFGGRTSAFQRKECPTHKAMLTWVVTTHRCRAIIEAVLPYLVIKRRQAELLIEFDSLRGRPGVRLDEKTIQRRQEIIDELRLLNSRGRKKLTTSELAS